MASQPKRLKIVDAYAQGRSTRVLEIVCVDGDAFSHVGGRYIIVHTGLVIDEKPVKRAYSLIPSAMHPDRAHVAVKRLDGPGSTTLHTAGVGSTFAFSGPWGKLVPEHGLAERTLLVATDTGITSALGIVERQSEARGAGAVDVLWLVGQDEDFLDREDVRRRIERTSSTFACSEIPPVGSPERTHHAWACIGTQARAYQPTHVIATGDGDVVYPLREWLPQHAPSVVDVRIECFFNNPTRKSA